MIDLKLYMFDSVEFPLNQKVFKSFQNMLIFSISELTQILLHSPGLNKLIFEI